MFGDGKHTVAKPHGEVHITPLDGGPSRVADTLQCQHCMKHWVVVPGSGRRRGWCLRCNGPLCGKPECMQNCVPFMAKVEGKKPW